MSNYELIPEHPTATEVRKYVKNYVDNLFTALSTDRLLSHGDTDPVWEVRYEETINSLSRRVVEWLERNDTTKIGHWGMQP